MFGPHATKQYGSLVTSATDKERKHTCLRKVRLRCKQKASTVCSDVIFTLHGSHVLVIAMDEALPWHLYYFRAYNERLINDP